MSLAMPEIFPVACHTDQVGVRTTFVAINGLQQDGMAYISQALHKGARTIVVTHEALLPDHVIADIAFYGATLTRVKNTRKALAALSAQAAGYPAGQLRFIGVTGTKGKTTTVHLIAHFLRTAGYKVALLSTTQNVIDEIEFPASLTTAQPDYLHQFFALCVQQEVTIVVMEVAAQALTLHRLDGIAFELVVFTNFSPEHLEFYQSLDDYFAAKCQLMAHLLPHGVVLVNGDDERSATIAAQREHSLTFGFSSHNQVRGLLHDDKTQVHLTVKSPEQSCEFMCKALVGKFNGYNMLAAVAAASYYHCSAAFMSQALASFKPVRGRFERHDLAGGVTAIIDYAHNPASYEVVLPVLRSMTDYLIVLFGAGGRRDPAKRPSMGAIVARYADEIIVTSDNPRDEDPLAIMADIIDGMPLAMRNRVWSEPDRYQAIEYALKIARPGSVIGLLGKGAEDYQIIGTDKFFFSEVMILKQLARVLV